MTETALFPPLRPRESGYLDRDNGHRVYWEESGRPDGRPVLFLHGGPGAGTAPVHRRFFDPAFYRIVLIDQRGCGRSAPFGETAANTTQALVGDIEALRARLGIPRWLVFGGSWGSTLALAYAEAHPARVAGLVLRGIFLGRWREIEWFLHGMRTVFPEAWRAFVEHIPEAERGDILAAYHRRLNDPAPEIHMPAARTWSGYEAACSTLLPRNGAHPVTGADAAAASAPSSSSSSASGGDRWALGLARLEAHYFVNRVFIEDGALLDGIPAIGHLPGIVVQGRYDMVCPIVNADELVRAWPGVEYVVVPDAGHSALEPGVTAKLVAATEAMKTRAAWD